MRTVRFERLGFEIQVPQLDVFPRPIYFSSTSAVFWLSWRRGPVSGIRKVLEVALNAGCAGVEWLLLKPLLQGTIMEDLVQDSEDNGVGCRFHEMWDSGSLSTHVLSVLGLLPERVEVEYGRRRRRALDLAPTVIFASSMEDCGPNAVVQTGGNMGKGITSLETLFEQVERRGCQLAFDLMHLLEIKYGPLSGGLSASLQMGYLGDIQDELFTFFTSFRELIGEVHLYNFRPLPRWILDGPWLDTFRPGLADLFCKNLLPEKGVFNNARFLSLVVDWQGPIVLELHPRVLVGSAHTKLRRAVKWTKSRL